MKKTILIVDDDEIILEFISEILTNKGYLTLVAKDGIEALKIIENEEVSIVISDLEMPRMNGIQLLKWIKKEYSDIETIIITGYGTIETGVEAMKIGAFDYVLKPIDRDYLLLLVDRICEKQNLLDENIHLFDELSKKYHFNNIVGQSSKMLQLFEEIKWVSGTDATVLLVGESGTGKELVASAIHYSSQRKSKPFVKISCAAIPEGIIESELFGHEKGAYTTAVARKRGKFELAEGGTLFLDEIGDLPLSTQVKLLRVLETKEFERVGGLETIKVDARLITATNRDLVKLVQEKKFREDLFYRLDVVTIYIPHLRDREGDTEHLANHFLHKYSLETNKKIDNICPQAMALLQRYDWPGNVRELENAIERSVVFCQGNVIKPGNLPEQIRKGGSSLQMSQGLSLKNLALVEKSLINDVVGEANGNLKKAADILGISRGTLYSKMKKFGIRKSQKQ